MTMPWLTLVIPTIGREGLKRTLDSVDHQIPDGVEILVVGDSHGGTDLTHARNIVLGFSPRYRWVEHDGGQHCYGQPQRNFGARMALGEWVAFSQDDNILTQGSLTSIWMALVQEKRKRPLFFRWLSPWRHIVWSSPHLAQGNIDADCLVLPKAVAQQVEWGMRYEGDFDAADQAFRQAEGDVGWREELISIARPGPEHIWWKP